jgi:hypothetical protein
MHAMKESIQIRIPTPCGENWEGMDRRELGRFCQQCQKTVVDFTGMMDAEVLGYFAARGGEGDVCGRFLPEQVGRGLAPGPVQRNGWAGWRWVLASMLMLVRPSERGQPAKGVAVERRVTGDTVRAPGDVTMGTPMRVIEVPKVRKKMARFVRDSVMAWRPPVIRLDSVEGPAVGSTIPVINGVVRGAGSELVGYLGAVSIRTSVSIDTTILQKVVDTLSAWPPLRKEDFVTLYPNPVERGGALHLAWLSEEGKYELALLNMRGQLIAERVVEVSGAGQVDQWVLPVGLAAGVYVVKILKDGRARVMTREVAVR